MFKPTTIVWQSSASLFFKLSVITSAIAVIGLTTGCSSTASTNKPQTSKQLGLLDANSLDSLQDLLSATDMRAVEGDRLLILKHGDVWKRMTVGFKMDETHWDPRIEAQRSWFTSRQPYIDRLSARASRYLYHTVKEAERRGLPTELALLPVIESSYDPAATSSAAAAGMWQFIPSTGRIYGLRQNSLYDGRRDVVESTRAAYEFLGSLYNQFGSWELALAAYNAGPGRIQQAINRNKAAGLPTDYWSLKLPQETMNYVPRFLAVAQIIKSPQNYGVSLPPIANRPHFREVSVPAGTQLNQIASIAGLSRAELYQLNPGHRGEVIDPQSTMRILIPVDSNPNVDSKLKALQPTQGSYWAGAETPSANSSVSTKTSITPMIASAVTPPALNNTKPSTTVSVVTTPKPLNSSVSSSNTAALTTSKPTTFATSSRTPVGSAQLAAFAASADIPSAPRIPVAVTPAVNVKPVRIEPAISEQERAKILASVAVDTTTTAEQKIEQVLEPSPSQAETEQVVQEITALAPTGTEVVDPLDGKIKLTAIQTSQSVAAQRGSEVKVGFAYPKGVAESTSETSDEAQRNQGKSFTKTDSEVVFVPPTGKRTTYTVLPGDTLAVIALKNGVNWRDIAKWNQVDPNTTLFVGTTLYLYDAKPAAIADKKVEPKLSSYSVKPNDSLTSVASQFNLSVQQLADWNGLTTSSNLLVGQKLSLVESTAKRLVREDKSAERNGIPKVKTKVYVVKRGEYLKQIADRYAFSNQELASLTSGLKADSALNVGQRINVPSESLTDIAEETAKSTAVARTQNAALKADTSVKTENYKVQSGETLYSIAMKSKITLAELAELNNVSTNKGLMAGQTLKIPAGNSVPESYTVQSGDSLNAVASKYNLNISQIASLNGMSPTAGLWVGQKLKLTGEPEAKKATNSNAASTSQNTALSSKSSLKHNGFYVVASGDTLASIARKYNLQLNYLAELNGLSRTSGVNIGQRLKIENDQLAQESTSKESVIKTGTPKELSGTSLAKTGSNRNTESYSVKSGESLNVIANRVGLSVKDLADLNNLNMRAGLQRGQTIQIPKTVTEYKVKSGDSLIRLASRYGVDSNQLAEMNDMKPNAALRIGDTIKVPNL